MTPVSVVLTVLNEAGSIQQVLGDLLEQDLAGSEIVVVDGGSTDGTLEAVRAVAASHPCVRLLEAPGANISQGRNRGIEAAANDVLAVLDAGVRLSPDWLRHITAPMADQRADVVAGFFEADPQTPFETALGATSLPLLSEVDPGTFLPSSRSLAFTRSTWQRAGGYPEWLDYCEDLIFDIRLRGDPTVRIVFEPRATVRFRPRSSLRRFFRQYYRYARGDGKADLWRRRHATRYGSYLYLLAMMATWLAPSARRHQGAVAALIALTLAGAAAYLAKPVWRLLRLASGASLSERAWMLALIPVIRVTGDLAKMLGYPVGWTWRLKHQPKPWR